MSVEPEPRKSTSSRIRRSATTLNSLLGTSMPTALLPGIGASIRMLRAARAIDRSSDSASIRLTLMCGAGWTSYWVTTGPALRPTMRASMSKLLSFSMIRASFHVWTASALAPAAAVGSSFRSSSSIGGSTQAIALAAGRRVRGVGDVLRVAERGRARPPSPARPPRAGRAERRDRRGGRRRASGRRRARRRRRCPAPDAGLARRVDGRDLRCAALARRARPSRPRPRRPRPPSRCAVGALRGRPRCRRPASCGPGASSRRHARRGSRATAARAAACRRR